MKKQEDLKEKEDIKNSKKEVGKLVKFEQVIGWLFIILGAPLIFSALPQQTPNVINLFVIKLNVGTQLDLIRLIVGSALIIIGYKGIKRKW